MARPTLHDRLVAALLARGERIVENARTTRYTVLTREGGGGFYFVGKAGALRIGRTVADSHPAAESVRRRFLDGA